MVVAHPDDETFWGGITLGSQDGWGVICLTNRSNRKRRRSLSAALRIYGVPSIHLSVPDRGPDLPTMADLDEAANRIQEPLLHPRIRQVLTHGPDGEYGHPLHIAVSGLATRLLGSSRELWYFNFDENVDWSIRDPRLWHMKVVAAEQHLGPQSKWEKSDMRHLQMGLHEAPCLAEDYHYPGTLMQEIYGDQGLDQE